VKIQMKVCSSGEICILRKAGFALQGFPSTASVDIPCRFSDNSSRIALKENYFKTRIALNENCLQN